MAKNKRYFNKHEVKIIKAIHKSKKPLSISKLSKKSRTSWNTAKKYARRLEGRKYIVSKTLKKRNRFQIFQKYCIIKLSSLMDIIILKKLAPIFNQFFNFVYKPTNQNNNSNNKPMNELLLKVLCHNICVVIQEMM